MNQLAAICVKRPVFATVLILVLVVFGVFGYMKLGVDRFPKIDFPMVTVTTRQPGAAPEEIETGVTQKIEDAVSTVNGIEELRSISSEGVSQVFIQFVLEKDVDIAAQDVRDKINHVVLDPDVKQPIIEKIDLDAIAVVTIALSAPPPATLRDITEYADKVLRRQLQTIDGVGEVMIVGGQARQINVVLDPMKLRAQKLTVADVARALGAQNLQMPSGSMKVGPTEYTLRTMGRVDNMREMEAITVANRDGRTITVGDLGRAEDSTEEMESSSLYNDTPCVLLNIRKQSGTNTVEVATHVEGTARRTHADRAEGLQRRSRPRPVGLHRGVGRYGERAPDARRPAGGGRGVRLPGQLSGHADRRPLHSRVDHRRLRHRPVHGLHAQQHEPVGLDAFGGHRDRRRHRGHGEHLPLYRGEGLLAP